MARAAPTVVVAVCLVSAVAGTLAFCDRVAPEPETAQGEREARRAEEVSLEPAPSAIRISARGIDQLRLRVVSERGDAVPRAQVVRAAWRASWARPDAVLATSNDDGYMTVAREVLLNGNGRVCYVYHPEYRPALLVGELSAEETVVLRSGAELRVVCESELGEPVPGVAVAVARTSIANKVRHAAMEVVPDGQALVPGPNDSHAVHRGTTDSLGVALFRGLVPGNYCVKFAHPHLAMIDGIRSSCHHPVPGPEIRTVWTPAMAAVLRVVGDDLLAWSAGRSRREFERGLPWATFVGRPDVDLRRRYPTQLVFVDVPSADHRRNGTAPSMKLSLLGATSGWTTIPVSMVPVADVTEPRTIVLPRGTADLAGSVTLRVDPPPASSDPPIFRFFFVLGSFDGRTVQRPIPDNGSLRLPHGSYDLHVNSWFLRKTLVSPVRFEVRPGEQRIVDVRFASAVTACRLEFEAPDGMDLPPLDLRLVDANGTFDHLGRWTPDDEEFIPRLGRTQWFPAGPLRIDVSGHGLVHHEGRFVVEATPEGGLQVLHMKLVANARTP